MITVAGTKLVVEIEWDPEGTVTGTLTGRDGELVEFHGWLSLAAAIEELTDHVRQP